MSQAAVTDYFTRRRNRGLVQPSKRQKINDVTPQLDTKELKISGKQKTKTKQKEGTEKRVTRSSTRKTTSKITTTISSLQEYFSPTNKNKSEPEVPPPCLPVTVTTAARDDHDDPVTPSKRRNNELNDQSTVKRGRITPKKSFEFDESTTQVGTDFSETRSKKKSARKRLTLRCDVTDDLCDVINKKDIKNDKSEKVLDSNLETIEESPCDVTKPSKSDQSTSKPGRRKKIQTDKAVNIAEKLLNKDKSKESSKVVKEVLKGQGNLKDLQKTLLKMRELKKQEKKSKKVDENKNEIKEKKEVKKRVFAHERFHSLAQEIPSGLSLPFKYKILQEMFQSADTVVSMLFNRQQTTTWLKLHKAVKDMIKRKFELNDLGRIKHVYPDAYTFRQERGIPTYDDRIKSTDYQLTIEPILTEEECDRASDEPRKLNSGMLVRRRHNFHLQLLSLVKFHHKEFLASLEPPVVVDDAEIRRWHPQFPVDQVPDITVGELPTPPNLEKCSSAKDVLEKTKDRLTKKAFEALKKVAEKCSTPEKSVTVETNNNQSPTKKPVSVKGVSQSLLAKIREKEASSKLRKMVRSDESEKKIEKMKQLPDVARALRMLFVTEKKASLPLELIVARLAKCCPSVATPVLMEEHVRLLSEHMTSWAIMMSLGKKEYLKLDKNRDISDVIKELQCKVKELENCAK
uniref:DNA replication factor Cdt1 isoform X1 n=1 Tax=Ciona intestinalis TaxID=7719 RepID=UPI000180CB58|nr:DNA replication factor Cdt1 isoform X1 [Ciona intestinalis]|eukprot:XP_002131268.1 DNA replication factor Cdt1 isoform X1 [Ciona intestinalis]